MPKAVLPLILVAALVALAIACSDEGDEPASVSQTAATVTPALAPTTAPADDAPPSAIDVMELFADVWQCADGEGPSVQDYSTPDADDLTCEIEVEYTDTTVIIRSSGIPNHDLESTIGCCAAEQEYEWIIPRFPTPDEDGDLFAAPELGAVAFTVAGVAIFGPEEGPGGDAVALHHGYFVEDRQPIELGICGGHSGPGGQYHYHYDANCIHWHPPDSVSGAADRLWAAYQQSEIDSSAHSDVIGFGFDGYPIYGVYGWDEDGATREMTSSYRLKDGADGYNGIDDWEYVEGLGDMDQCNGHTGPTPHSDVPIYHYHTTWRNGEDAIGFPYFLLCYHGQVDEEAIQSMAGIGIGPPPDGRGPPNGQGGPPPPGGGPRQ